MKTITNYRPDKIEFTVESKRVPQSLGEFKTEDEARTFMAQNLLAVQTKLSTERFMDQTEIEGLRDMYTEELEDNLPLLRQDHLKKAAEMEKAKKIEKDAKEMVSASLNKVQQLANEVNERTTEIDLDQAFTWEVVYDGKKFYYTYMDKIIQLAKVEDIPSYEMDDLISSSEKNAEFFVKQLEVVNG